VNLTAITTIFFTLANIAIFFTLANIAIFFTLANIAIFFTLANTAIFCKTFWFSLAILMVSVAPAWHIWSIADEKKAWLVKIQQLPKLFGVFSIIPGLEIAGHGYWQPVPPPPPPFTKANRKIRFLPFKVTVLRESCLKYWHRGVENGLFKDR